MTISVVQAPSPFGDATSGDFGDDVTEHNTVFLIMNAYALSDVTISTSDPLLGGAAVTGAALLGHQQSAWDGTLTAYTAIWQLPDCPGGADAVALTLTNGEVNTATGLWAFEVAGLGTAPSLDKSAAANGTSGIASSGASGDIITSPELILGACAQNSPESFGQPGGFTGSNLEAGIAGYQIAASAGNSYTYDVSNGGDEWAAVIVTIAAGSITAAKGLLLATLP
jgi:hypothetical protein